jgi:pimeloyl-ACP methyl ester carboxylesterase
MEQTEAPRAGILMIAGFGDNASMFDGLSTTELARKYALIPYNLPGFGAPPLDGETTIDALAEALAHEARATGAKIVLAHSVASIIASIALSKDSLSKDGLSKDSPLEMILSIEGNITADDAYFSGTAANYEDPASFRTAFLTRLAEKAENSAIFARYHDNVAKADPTALWHLGRDAGRFSEAHHPGECLVASGRVSYLYDDPNCPDSTLDWLQSHDIDKRRLVGASHWPSVDAPDLLSTECLNALASV